ncbi:V-type ATP synthase subunit K [Deinococcus peraridilitoris]|uniref:ATP synthase subunit C n=1 Tax=Deinococcus peraridilitoris (strain DSM 19664 / LMG 22246 / CIP 109416 / KR-200) TaxID=937777 RepID=L0A3R7_DEIPD|nr:V-type ATP synthase subunit K [Deinococcus peraridilitoris]AFZ67832.1 ATP synthase subunit C [Deinococcus peraridilitoris DSM 19664]
MFKYLVALLALALVSFGFAQEAGAATALADDGIRRGLLGVGMGLAIGLGAIGAGIAQGRIGAAAAGAIAEDPSKFGQMLILVVIPETLVIFGLLIAFLIPGLAA